MKYCKNCKYFKKIYHPIEGFEIKVRCLSPWNKVVKDNWRTRYSEFIQSPRSLNKKNDCKNYKEKGWIFWIK